MMERDNDGKQAKQGIEEDAWPSPAAQDVEDEEHREDTEGMDEEAKAERCGGHGRDNAIASLKGSVQDGGTAGRVGGVSCASLRS